MTDDKRYSLSEASKSLLRSTREPIEVTILLDGDLNAGFRRLKKATEETLDEMGVYGKVQREKVQSTFSDKKQSFLSAAIAPTLVTHIPLA